jgi:hypothetical protein
MGAPQQSKEALNNEDQAAAANTVLAQKQATIMDQQQQQSAADRARALALEQPLIDKETALAGADKTAALKASMPVISQITGGYDAARTSIFNSVPAGAARDKALADLDIQKATTTAGTQASLVEGAPDKLASIGSGFGGMSLNENASAIGAGGAGASANSSAANIYGNVSNQAFAQSGKTEALQLFTSVAGAAGTAAGIKIGSSDRRIKQDVVPVNNILEKLLRDVHVYAFNYVSDDYDKTRSRHIGVMAQDVEKNFPELISERAIRGHQIKFVDYGALAALAIGGLIEMSKRVDALETELAKLTVGA